MAERAARHLSERLGNEAVTSHHGSLARASRLAAEQRLKRGELKALVATASLELGIDIGEVDLVCQLGSTRSIATLLQRVGRSGHAVDGMPKGRLFPLSRDELVECAALLDSVRRGELDRLTIPRRPLDVLAQQIVAEVAMGEWREDELFALVRRAHPFRDLERAAFNDVVRMLAEGFDTRRGRRNAHIHRDAVNGVLRGRRGAALTAVTSGGTIPDTADYSVVLEPQALTIGSVNEDFAVESLAGDVFQLGNISYRILRVERGHGASGRRARRAARHAVLVRRGAVEDARSCRNRYRGCARGWRLESISADKKRPWFGSKKPSVWRAPRPKQIVEYLAAAKAALGALPTFQTVVMERFFDESGGMQLVIHSPFGSRINRAWGLALRKRFCRKFNFELQAAATEDAIILSLATSHSFPLEDVAHYLSSKTVRPLLVQALLDAPMFATRWRWDASIALALLRMRGGRKVPPQLQRMAAEDLLAAIFPDQIACAENVPGEREIPDHPLVAQAIGDCLHEAMDVAGLERVLADIERGAIHIVSRDLTEPSPLAAEILSARPYAYLDDAPLEERRTQAVMARRWLDPETASDLGQLDPSAIARVREEIWPDPRNADELHDALLSFGFLTADEAAPWTELARELAAARRATQLGSLYVAAERLPELRALLPMAALAPEIEPPAEIRARSWTREEALVEVIRDRLEGLGPTTSAALAAPLGVSESEMAIALARLQSEGAAMQGSFTPGAAETEWCERRLLARIHRYTVNRLRREIEPVEARDFLRFLFRWQRVSPDARA